MRTTYEIIEAVKSGAKPIFAGYVNESGTCWGKSVSLNLISRGEEDTRLLQRISIGVLL